MEVWTREALGGRCWLLVLLVATWAARPAWGAGDDGLFTLVVERDANLFYSRAVDHKIYLDERYVGAVGNGNRIRFAVPVNARGRYELAVKDWGSWFSDGTVSSFEAAPSDEVLVRTGVDFLEGILIHEVRRSTSAAIELLVEADGPVALEVDGRTYALEFGGRLVTAERTSENKPLRLEVGVTSGGTQERFVLFARPGRPGLVQLGSAVPSAGERLLASAQLLQQVRDCVWHHLEGDLDDLPRVLEALVADLSALRTRGASPEFVAFRDETMSYCTVLRSLARDRLDALGRAGLDLLLIGLQFAVEAVVTKQMPSTAVPLGEAVFSVLQGAWALHGIDSDVAERTGARAAVEARLEDELLAALRADGSLAGHPFVESVLLPAELIGAWAFPFAQDDGAIRGDCYVLEPGGRMRQLSVDGERIWSSPATYRLQGSQLAIDWSTSQERGTLRRIAPGRLEYVITAHTGDPRQVGMRFELGRLSDAGRKGAVSFANPTDRLIRFSTRWALLDGNWTGWKVWTAEAGEEFWLSCPDAFHCELTVESSSVLHGFEPMATGLPVWVADADGGGGSSAVCMWTREGGGVGLRFAR